MAEQFKASTDVFDTATLLDGSQAHIAKDGAKSLVDDRSLTRFWPGRSPIALEQMCAALRARRTELNPVADQKTFPGTWRVQDVYYKTDPKSETGYAYEQLALGLITKIAEHAQGYDPLHGTRDPDVRMISVKIYPQTETLTNPAVPNVFDPNTAYEVLTRHWPYVDPNQTEALIAEFKSVLTITDPVASGDLYPGIYKIGKVWAEKNEDGSDQIIMECYQNLSANYTEPYTVNMEEDMILIYKEGMAKTELEAFLAAYRRTPKCPTVDSATGKVDPADGYIAGLHNSIQVGYDIATGLYNISIKQEVFYDTSTPVTATDAGAAYPLAAISGGGAPDGGGGGGGGGGVTIGSKNGCVPMYLHEAKNDYHLYRADYNHEPIEPVITADDINKFYEITLEKKWDPVGLWQGYKMCKQDLGGEMQNWPERIVGFTIFANGITQYVIVAKKWFAQSTTPSGVDAYCVTLGPATSGYLGISAEVNTACGSNYTTPYGVGGPGWIIAGGAAGHRTGVANDARKDPVILATRVQIYFKAGAFVP